jgi:hypothetical protein
MRTTSLPRWVWALYAVLFALSVPWYLPSGPVRLWLGLPYWAMLSLLAMTGVAGLTLVVVRRYWIDDDEGSSGDSPTP